MWSVLGLAGFHTFLAACNLTTNEDVGFCVISVSHLMLFTSHLTRCNGTLTEMQQMVKVILQQAILPPHMDGSVVFARWY